MSNRRTAGLLIVIGTIFVVSALVFWNFRETMTGASRLNIPQNLAGLSLSQVSYGPEAVNEIDLLHNKQFPLVNGAMGTYGGSNQATLWVAEFADNATASQEMQAMEEKIATVDSPFTPTSSDSIDGRTIYRLDGMGQKHIYFQSTNRVIWLAVDPILSEQAITQILRIYP